MQDNKDKTGKFITLAFLGGVAVILSLFLAPAIHLGMAQKLTDPQQLLNIGGNIIMLFSSGQGALIFIAVLLTLLGLACLAVFMSGSSNSLTPQMRNVTDKIKTPVPAGQKQHGSADWLPREMYAKSFGTATLDTENASVQHLVAHGADDLEFVKQQQAEEKRLAEEQRQSKGKAKPGGVKK